MTSARPVAGVSASATSRSRPTSRPTSAEPPRPRPAGLSGSAAGGSPGNADQQGVALPAAAAQPGRAEPAATAAQLHREGEHQPGAARADRVAQRDRATVDVDDRLVQAELTR